jgi:hypothetical protein
MPVSICPRCKHVNPDYASYCFYDGSALHANQAAVVLQLPSEFVFPSGRRCKSFDDLAQGCQEEWTAARDLLTRGVFAQFFKACNRADLVRAAGDAKAQANPDIALTTFLSALPGTRTQTPKLDLHPRRILLGTMLVGESKTVPLTITNQAAGMLQGTVSVTEGQDWLSLSDAKPVHEIEVNTVREQVVKLTIKTKGVAAGQTYGAKLTVVTNGGVVEVPLRMELAAQPYPKAPFQGVRTQRELAEKMRGQPKVAVPILESGDVQRWFAANGWTYPVPGTPVKGVGGVQQFFEGMGVSKSPPVELTPVELRLTCKPNDTQRAQVMLQTAKRKWVYAQIRSDSPWLKPIHAQVAGPQKASIPLEIDTHHWSLGGRAEGKLTVEANGGQRLTLKVTVEVHGAAAATKPKLPPAPIRAPEAAPFDFSSFAASEPVAAAPADETPRRAERPLPTAVSSAGGFKFVPALATMVLVCLMLRIILIPLIDLEGRSAIAAAAASKLGFEPSSDSPFHHAGGWLQLPWLAILGDVDGQFPASVFRPGPGEVKTTEFRHYFVSYFVRWFVLCTFWIGAILGVILVLRRGGTTHDVPWAIVAGAGAGLAGAATLAALFLGGEMLPHAVWQLAVGAHGGAGYLALWSLIAVACWLLIGVGMGLVVPWIRPLRRLLIDPFQALLAGLFDICGMKGLAQYWRP